VCHLPFQDLRRSPSRAVNQIARGASCRIKVPSDRGKTKTRDPYVVCSIHEYIGLGACQDGRGTGLKLFTYSLEIAMNYVA